MNWKIKKTGCISGQLEVPPDKSISHRAIMFGSLAKGQTVVNNFLTAGDSLSTLEAFRMMGVKIELNGKKVVIQSDGLNGLDSPKGPIDAGNSGTTMRIISGILAAQHFKSEIIGDKSLSKRPMDRVIKPLKMMGANITAISDKYSPIKILPALKGLKCINYTLPVASAQVKSALLAAGLYAKGRTVIREPYLSRDHTERMLKFLGADIKINSKKKIIWLNNTGKLTAKNILVPGDISSAAFFLVGALIVEDSDLVIKNIGLNPTRTGIIDILKRMGACIRLDNLRTTRSGGNEYIEPSGDIHVKYSKLKGTVIKESEIPLLIDEVPILVVAALRAKGKTVINGIRELKVKETDRITSMRLNLEKMGAVIEEKNGALHINGPQAFKATRSIESFGDHRTAMSMAISALLPDDNQESVINDVDCVNTSYPNFFNDLKSLMTS